MSKVFLVEDDSFISRVYERAFRLGDHEIELQTDAETAWAVLSAAVSLPAVILLDITLPKMSGVELLEKLRKETKFDHTPIAILTNSFDEDIEKKVLAAGADMYLLKIANEPKELLEKVEVLINKAR